MTNHQEALGKLSRPVRQFLVFTADTALREKATMSLPDMHQQYNRWRDREAGPLYISYCFKKIAEQDLMVTENDQLRFTELGLKTALYALELAQENAAGFENILPSSLRPDARTTVSVVPNQVPTSPLLTVAQLGARPTLQTYD